MKNKTFIYSVLVILSVFWNFVYGAIPAEERAALIALYNSTNGDNWTDNTGWKTPPLHTDGFAMPGTEGTWYGITISSDHVTKIYLREKNLSGSIPPELGNLSNLEWIGFERNQLTGSIPSELQNLINLKYINLGFNQLTGTIPAWLGNLSNLLQLWLEFNQLTGSIPPELGNLSNLEYLWLRYNQLTGSIPIELQNLDNLKSLSLSSNQLSGNIPTWLGNLNNLLNLQLCCNDFSGSIPSELGNLSNLIWLHLHYNQLSGSIPSELGNLSNLEELRLNSNQLTGSIPPVLGNFSNLEWLELERNQLSGSIPPELGNLSNLRCLWLNNNQLTGSIPTEIGNLSKVTHLYLYSNQLTGTIPAVLGNLSNLISLRLYYNQLTGSIPPELGNLSNLESLYLYYNNLSGAIPTSLINLTKLNSPNVGIGYNCLYANDSELRAWLDSVDPDWEAHQDECINPPIITVTSPNGGESWGVGIDHNITWVPVGDVRDINIEYSTDGGINWESITLSAPNYGTYSWTVPNNPSSNCKIRISEASDGDPSDESDSVFSIVPEITKPTVTTNEVTSITSNSAVCGGNVTSDGGAFVTGRGVCWSTTSNPTTADSKTTDGSGIGSFTSNITGLSPNTKYYVRAYATNSKGTAYGNERNFTTLPLTTTYTLYVQSTPETGVNITVSPNDNNNYGNGSTNFTRTYNQGTQVTLTAPSIFNGKSFLKWVVDNVDKTDRTIAVTMDSDHTAQAVYQASTYTLTVQSSPDSHVPITVTPNDNNGQGNGSTQFFRTYDYGTIVNLTAPASHNVKNFVKWLIDGTEYASRTVQVTMNRSRTAQAVFQSPTYILTVQSTPYTGVSITISPEDKNGNGNGNTNFTRTYNSGTIATLTAPSSFSGSDFIKWTVDGKDYSTRTIQLTMNSNHTAVVYYETSRPPEISVNRTSLNFGYIIGSSNIPKETFIVYNSGGGTLNWSVSCELWRVTLSPVSGTNYGFVEVTFNLDGLPPQKCKKDVIYVSDPLVNNSPVEVKLNVWVKSQPESSPPFGEFATPIDGSIVYSSVPVTGWVLGDTGIENVKIYREQGSSLVYIGDAVFVEGARPDVEAAYPDYPMNYKAGWGYMMLTNFLPNGGNGTYKIHAIATDKEGRQTTLGIKTIICDNANAVKPFGAIDTPTQGGTASGSNFINWGWALTPQPNYIPTDGSTIKVYVDGVNIGHPTYNNYRKDIATLFPNYANSNGAVGYFYLDTTAYENGLHSIQWTATDNDGNTDGIGSRYFMIQNTSARTGNQQSMINSQSWSLVNSHWLLGEKELSSIPASYEPIRMRKGFERIIGLEEIYPDDNGRRTVEIKELEPVEIYLGEVEDYAGYLLVGNQLKPLPVGSTLDTKRGIFYWQPGPGFFGIYELVFIKIGRLNTEKINIRINILPKSDKK